MRPRRASLCPATWAALLLPLALAACGYHLRGSREAIAPLPPVHLSGDQSIPLYKTVSQTLHDTGTPIVARDQARLELVLLGEKRDRRVLSVGGDAQVEEYELTYSAAFEIRDGAGRPLLPAQTLRRRRAIRFDKEAVNSIVSEARQVYEDLRRAAAREIVQRLRSVAGREEVAP